MIDLCCPVCDHDWDVEYEDMPSHACDSRKVTCPSCGSVLLAGWVAVGDVREIIQRRQPPEVEQ